MCEKRNVKISISRLILIVNLLVFGLWRFNGVGALDHAFLDKNFLVSWDLLKEGRVWVLITSVFSHQLFFHFLLNMLVLINFGSILERILRWKEFLRLYILAGIFSSFCHALVSRLLLGSSHFAALGASGALSGVILVFVLMFPREKLYLFGLIPIPALFGALVFMGLDVWGLIAQAEGGGLPIGHGAHLGGAVFGIFYFFFRLRPRLVRKVLT